MELAGHILDAIYEASFGLSSRLNPLYILMMFPIAYLIYRHVKTTSPFLNWLFPRDIYAHPSTKTDVKLFVIGRILDVAGFLKVSFIHIFMVYTVSQAFGTTSREIGFGGTILVGLIFLITADFCVYWIHRGHHELKIIWPFHAVHHSAEVMSPLTVYRKHPVYDFLSGVFRAVVIGSVQGLVLALLFGQISIVLIGGVSVFLFVFNMTGANFRHSHIWISYGTFWSRIFISPAQHQIHHSLAHHHWHKNYGEVFAIWDWMFGTLYVPEKFEKLEFGLSTPDGVRIAQPHPTATDALCGPFHDVVTYLADKAPSEEAKSG